MACPVAIWARHEIVHVGIRTAACVVAAIVIDPITFTPRTALVLIVVKVIGLIGIIEYARRASGAVPFVVGIAPAFTATPPTLVQAHRYLSLFRRAFGLGFSDES